MAELRSFIFIDQLQPQTMCYLGTWIRGRLPRTNMAAQIIEIAPGLDIEPLTDVALKSTDVQAGILIVERQFGYLEIHSRSTAAVQAASTAVLAELGATPGDATRPQILASELISRIDHQHAFLINRNKLGSMALPGESLFVLEMQPASYAILATNEAEKAARIKVVDYRMIGATGRVYLSGMEADVRTAADAAVAALGRCGVSAGDEADVLRSVTREVLAELLPGLLEEALTAQPAANGNGHPAVADEPSGAEPPRPAVPQVPAPPVAAVHRPSGWRPPPESDTTARPPQVPAAASVTPEAATDATIERVDLRTDADLDAFVRSLVRRLENPRDRMAIRSGRLRFRLGAIGTGAGTAPAAGPAMRIERGAVTERTVRDAAAAGARLVLARRAVLTPMARDRARSLGVEIEKERPC